MSSQNKHQGAVEVYITTPCPVIMEYRIWGAVLVWRGQARSFNGSGPGSDPELILQSLQEVFTKLKRPCHIDIYTLQLYGPNGHNLPLHVLSQLKRKLPPHNWTWKQTSEKHPQMIMSKEVACAAARMLAKAWPILLANTPTTNQGTKKDENLIFWWVGKDQQNR